MTTEDRARFGSCQVDLHFGDGEYLFRLPIDQIGELQEKCGAGLGAIFTRVMRGEYRIEDLTETIRLGLVGGAQGVVGGNPVVVNALHAKILTQRYCNLMPKRELWTTAMAILAACVEGYNPPEDKKKDASGRATDGSMSGTFTGTAPSSELPTPEA